MSGNVKQNSKFEAITNVLNHIPNTVKKLYSGVRYSLSDPVIFVDSDGYTKRDMFDGSYAVQDVDKNGNPIQSEYIGGNTKQARQKYWDQAPIVRHAVDSIADVYGINPQILKDRLDKEGFVDFAIKDQNKYSKFSGRGHSNYSQLIDPSYSYSGFLTFGLDDVATLIEEGKVKPTKETGYHDMEATNEKGREVHSASGPTNLDNISLMAATLKYFRDEASRDFPKATRQSLDKAAGIYYNRGIAGGRKYIKKNPNSVR